MNKEPDAISAWFGWIGFASFMLALAGVFALITGFVALFQSGTVFVHTLNSSWLLTYTQWGWVHMLAGVLALAAAGSLLAGNMYGRIFAILVALASAIVNMAFIPMYPIWSIIIITIDVMVIYAVAVHGGELKDLN
jgi:hypothetical protein